MANIEKVLLFGSTGRIGTGLLRRLVTGMCITKNSQTPNSLEIGYEAKSEN